jgi:tripartite-type tricarboxylate transporter receptor subunit TctC
VRKINGDVQRILTDASFQEKFLTPSFFEPILGSVEQFGDYVKAEQAKWSAIIRDAKLTAE